MAAIYEYPKQVIELSLVAGGTLAPNTTYYFGSRYYGRYLAGHGPLSDQYSITTDTTNLSINVKVKYWDATAGAYSYTLPDTPFYAGNRAYTLLLWDSADMTDGAGNWVFNTDMIHNYISLNRTSGSLDRTYTSPPAYYSTAARYYYIPERYHREATGLTVSPISLFGWSLTEGLPVVYTESDADDWDDIVTAIEGCATFTGYTFFGYKNRTLSAHLSIYSAYDCEFNNLKLNLIYGDITTTAGKVNRCELNTTTYLLGKIGGGINVFYGDNNYLTGTSYRQNFSIDGVNNSVNSLGGQMGFSGTGDASTNYLTCLLLSNSLANRNNFSMYNSLLYLQIINNDQENSNIYQYTDDDMSWAYDWLFYNNSFSSYNNDDNTITIIDFVVDTTRATSEDIDYINDKKIRIRWSSVTGTTHVGHSLAIKTSIGMYLVDGDGTAIVGADVNLSNDFETLTGTTDADGYLLKAIKTRTAVQHPDHYSDGSANAGTYYTLWTDHDTLDLTISKTGYETYKAKVDAISKKELQITLKKAIDVVVSNKGVGIKADPTNSTKDREVIIFP
jgi:hypothetical protein